MSEPLDGLAQRVEALEKAVEAIQVNGFLSGFEKSTLEITKAHNWRRSEIANAERIMKYTSRIAEALSGINQRTEANATARAAAIAAGKDDTIEDDPKADAKELKNLRCQLWHLLQIMCHC